jgi:hypothetical protein
MKPFRHRPQTASPHDETATVVLVGFYKVSFESNASNEIYCGGLFGDERIRTVFEQETIALLSLNDATQAMAGFEKNDINLFSQRLTALDNFVCRSQSRYAAADYYDAFH